MFVTTETLRVVHLRRSTHVAIIAVGRVVERLVAGRERTRRTGMGDDGTGCDPDVDSSRNRFWFWQCLTVDRKPTPRR